MWLNLNVKAYRRNLVLCYVCLFVFSGCAGLTTYNPATGRKEFIAFSTEAEVELGANVHQQLDETEPFVTSGPQLAMLERVGARIAAVSDRQDYGYSFYLIEKDELNAFTTPGGNVYFYTGLVNRLGSEAQIAAVMAHEIGHCAAKHTIKQFQAGLGFNLLTSILLSQIDVEGTRQLTALTTGTIMNLVVSGYSRQDELQADRLSVKYLSAAGYDPHAMVEVLEFLGKQDKGHTNWELFRSHPDTNARIRAVNEEIERHRRRQQIVEGRP